MSDWECGKCEGADLPEHSPRCDKRPEKCSECLRDTELVFPENGTETDWIGHFCMYCDILYTEKTGGREIIIR